MAEFKENGSNMLLAIYRARAALGMVFTGVGLIGVAYAIETGGFDFLLEDSN